MLTPNVETIGSKNYSINKQFLIMKKQLLLLLFSLFAVAGYARVISGTVIAESDKLPVSYWTNHITATFVETIRWWIDNGKKETPETMTEYFLTIISI